MPCVQAQCASLPHDLSSMSTPPSELFTPDPCSRLPMEDSSSLPAISTLVGSAYVGDFDTTTYSCKITTSPATSFSPSVSSQAFKLDDFQVYGCYPGSFALLDETLASSDYYGSAVYAAGSSPNFQNQPTPVWDPPFTPCQPDKTQQLSMFSFSSQPEEEYFLSSEQQQQNMVSMHGSHLSQDPAVDCPRYQISCFCFLRM
ncbi:unnamed protein product [Knipowitschia caucasica]|uniref:Uncharacterized protein n=1 Tax=Knipowitschia caucasica TaxID=637954 RepID=A0AAV2M3G0_KNICA